MEGIETYCKTLGLGSFGMSALSAEIDVKDGQASSARAACISIERTVLIISSRGRSK